MTTTEKLDKADALEEEAKKIRDLVGTIEEKKLAISILNGIISNSEQERIFMWVGSTRSSITIPEELVPQLLENTLIILSAELAELESR